MKKFYIFIINFLLFQGGFAQTAIDVNQTFGEYTGSPKIYPLCTLQTDGKLIAHCFSGVYNGNPEKSLIRFNSDGTRDKTFDIGTGFAGAINGTFYMSSFIIQPNNKLIVAGEFTTFNGGA